MILTVVRVNFVFLDHWKNKGPMRMIFVCFSKNGCIQESRCKCDISPCSKPDLATVASGST